MIWTLYRWRGRVADRICARFGHHWTELFEGSGWRWCRVCNIAQPEKLSRDALPHV